MRAGSTTVRAERPLRERPCTSIMAWTMSSGQPLYCIVKDSEDADRLDYLGRDHGLLTNFVCLHLIYLREVPYVLAGSTGGRFVVEFRMRSTRPTVGTPGVSSWWF